MHSEITVEVLRALLAIAVGKTSVTTPADRHVLYRLGLIKKDASLNYVPEVTDKGLVYIGMLLTTPLPVPVNTPQWADPRKAGQ